MGRKFPFLPTCGGPAKTLSFRASTATATATTITGEFDDMFATGDIETSVESVIRGLSSERFFFNPGKTSSILEDEKPYKKKEKEKESVLPLKESVSMMEMQSTDPFADFKKSMQEMVEADDGLKEWKNLQELLSLYLAVNDKVNHGYIIGAFVDLLLVNLCSTLSSPSSSSSSSSSSSCSTSSSSSSIVSQEKSLLVESGSNSCSNNKNKMICSESTESALSLTSSSASSSATCSSSTSCSLEEDEEEEDHHSPQKKNHQFQSIILH